MAAIMFIGNQKYYKVKCGNKYYWRNSQTGQYRHTEIMEEIEGRPLEKNEIVHHKDENGLNNDPGNLELLNRSSHKRLHLEQDALEACGHADWRRCSYCGKYDDPKNMAESKRADRGPDAKKYRHKECYSSSKKLWHASNADSINAQRREKRASLSPEELAAINAKRNADYALKKDEINKKRREKNRQKKLQLIANKQKKDT